MGMFDTIIVKQPILCPKCSHKCKDFQTKELDRCLDIYKEGTTRRKIIALRMATPNERNKHGFILVPTKKYHYEPHPRNRDVFAYDWCKCEHFVNQKFRFDSKGRLKKIGQPRPFKL